jgi:1,2-dihydroxy-3-keto-5-methylthiopentene dioxygenase
MRAHWLDGVNKAAVLTPEALRADGLLYERLDVDAFRGPLDAMKRERGYVHEDEVALRPTTPGLEGICAQFVDEHLHDEDEVRFILEGEGIFDVRSRSDRYMRVVVETGDLLLVPAQRHHRFLLTGSKTIRAVRLFKDPSGWTPRYRAAR